MLVYYLREGVPIPLDFLTKRQQAAQEEEQHIEYERLASMKVLQIEYFEWCRKQAEIEVENLYSGAFLKEKKATAIARKDFRQFDQMSTSMKSKVARQILRPSFEKWSAENAQRVLQQLVAGPNTPSR